MLAALVITLEEVRVIHVPTSPRARALASVALLAAGALACRADSSTATRTGGTLRFDVADPPADTLDNPAADARPAFDLTGTRVRYKGDSLFFTLHVDGSVLRSGTQTSVFGLIELDTDQNPSTGDVAFADDVGATSGIGVDFRLNYSAEANAARLEDAAGNGLALLPAQFDADSIVIKVARTRLGNDDGNFDFAVVLGTFDRDTDFGPNAGRYTASATATVTNPVPLSADVVSRAASSRASASARAGHGSWRIR